MTLTRVYSESHKMTKCIKLSCQTILWKNYYTIDTGNKPTVLIKTCWKDKQCKDKEH